MTKNERLINESVKQFNREVDRLTARLRRLGVDLDAHAQDADSLDEDDAAQFEVDVKKLRLQKLGRK